MYKDFTFFSIGIFLWCAWISYAAEDSVCVCGENTKHMAESAPLQLDTNRSSASHQEKRHLPVAVSLAILRKNFGWNTIKNLILFIF